LGWIIEKVFWLAEIKFGDILSMVTTKISNFLRESETKNQQNSEL
jgi:hypothetical protein